VLNYEKIKPPVTDRIGVGLADSGAGDHHWVTPRFLDELVEHPAWRL
jgi:hypothetical protein